MRTLEEKRRKQGEVYVKVRLCGKGGCWRLLHWPLQIQERRREVAEALKRVEQGSRDLEEEKKW